MFNKKNINTPSLLNPVIAIILLSTLALFSGACGIAYELLYSRVLSTYLGDMFYINASILCAFFLSMSVGALISERYYKHLPVIEIFIGVYAIFAAILFKYFLQDFIVATAPDDSLTKPQTLILTVWVLLVVPATLIGFSVPLFTQYLKNHSSTRNIFTSFANSYSLYNVGAVICILLVEYLLIRNMGISISFYILATLNIIIGFLLYPFSKKENTATYSPISQLRYFLSTAQNKKLLTSFIILGIASGIFQLLFLKVTYIVLGPHHENFSLVIALALTGIVTGSYFSKLKFITLSRVSFWGVILVSLSILLIDVWGIIWSIADKTTLNTIIALTTLGIIPFTILGTLAPLTFKEISSKNTKSQGTGGILFISSLSNCLGFLIMIFLVHSYFHDALLVITVPILFFISYLILNFKNKKNAYLMLLIPLVFITALYKLWPTDFFSLSYNSFTRYETLAYDRKEVDNSEVIKKYNHRVSIAKYKNNEKHFILDGYKSVGFFPDGVPTLREIVHGIAPALYAPSNNDALVLGLGTGVTAGAAAQAFENVDVVEVNPVMMLAVDKLKEENFNIKNAKNVNFFTQDALVYLLQSDKKYDSIINTVTGPVHFSASKLYSKEFFEIAKTRLKKNGTYSLWMGYPMSAKGVEIIYQTLKESFSDCDFIFLAQNYHNIVCKASGLLNIKKPNENIWSDDLKREFKQHSHSLSIFDFLTSIIFPNNLLFSDKNYKNHQWSVRSNTLDKPNLIYFHNHRTADYNNTPWAQSFKENAPNIKTFYLNDPDRYANLTNRCSAFFILNYDMRCSGYVMAENCGVLPLSHAESMLRHYLRWGNRENDIRDLVVHLRRTNRGHVINDIINKNNTYINGGLLPLLESIKATPKTQEYNFKPFYVPPNNNWRAINASCPLKINEAP